MIIIMGRYPRVDLQLQSEHGGEVLTSTQDRMATVFRMRAYRFFLVSLDRREPSTST